MRGRTTSALIVSFTFLSILLLLGGLTSASGNLSRMEMTTTATTTSQTSSSATGLHELTFIQDREGSYPFSYLPWSITLSNGVVGNLTEVNPSNATILPGWTYHPCEGAVCTSSSENANPNPYDMSTNQSLSTITFLVPYGSYHYEEYSAFGLLFGQVDFSPSNPLPVAINPIVVYCPCV
jgi:hypothetical protein